MDRPHGLPTVGVPAPFTWVQDNRRLSHGHHDTPPTPQSAGTAMDASSQAVNALHASMARKQQKMDGYQTLLRDRHFYMSQAKTSQEQLGTALQDMSHFKDESEAEIRNQKNLRVEAEDRSAEYMLRAVNLEQDKNNLEMSVGLLQPQVAALKDEKTALRSEMESKETTWEAERARLTADKTTADQALAGQRSVRVRLEATNEKLEDDIATSNRKLDELEGDKKKALEAVQGEMAAVRKDLAESMSTIDRLNHKISALEDHRRTIETANNGLGEELKNSQKDKAAVDRALFKANTEIKTLTAENDLQAAELRTLAEQSKELDGTKQTVVDLRVELTTLNDALKKQEGELDSITDSRRTIEEECKDKLKRMQSAVDVANQDKNSMETKMSDAQVGAANITKALDRTQKSLRQVQEQKRLLDQRSHNNGQERDLANAARADLARQVTELKRSEKQLRSELKQREHERDAAIASRTDLKGKVSRLEQVEEQLRQDNEQLRHDNKQLRQELQEERSTNDRASEVMNSRKKLRLKTPAPDESEIENLVKSKDHKPDEAAIPSKRLPDTPCPTIASSTNPIPAGHITPPPETDNTAESSTCGQPRLAAESSPAGATSSEASCQPTRNISFSLVGQTSPKASTPQARSPLAGSMRGADRTDSTPSSKGKEPMGKASTSKEPIAGKNDNGKRPRNEEQSLDPRRAKKPSGTARNHGADVDRNGGGDQDGRIQASTIPKPSKGLFGLSRGG